MAYGIKYQIQYLRFHGDQTTIDIRWKYKADDSGIIQLKGGASPFTKSWQGDATNIYAPSVGSGAVLNIVGTPLTLNSLFTNDPQEYMVKVYNGVSGSTLIWQGFISAEIYSEGYSNPILSEVSLQCTDGMVVLDNILYQDTSSFYSGDATIATILSNILGKLALTFNTVYTSNDLYVDVSHTNFFTYLDLFNENFVDESNVPMSCRAVLEALIGSMGMVVYFEADCIYIIDPINLHDTTKGKSYVVAGFGSETTISLGGYLDISNKDINWGATGSNLDIIPSVSEAHVNYNPYNFCDLSYDFANLANWNYAGVFNTVGGYQYNNTIDYKQWIVDSADTMQIAMRQFTYSKPEYVLQLQDNQSSIATWAPQGAVVSQDAGLHIKVSLDIYMQTKTFSSDIFTGGIMKDITRELLPIAIKVGNQYWHGGISWSSSAVNKWQQMWVVGSIMEADYATATINDKWITANIQAPLWPTQEGTLLTGQIQVEILDNLTTQFGSQILPLTKPFFSTNTTYKTVSFGDSGVTWAVVDNSTIRITIVGFKTYTGIGVNRTLFDAAVSAIITNLGSGTAFGGTYHNNGGGTTPFSSTVVQTSFIFETYTASTNTLVFRVYTSGTPYFAGDFNYFLTGYATQLIHTYSFFGGLAFIKNVHIEIVDSWSRENIANNGVQEKALLSTNLTGKSPVDIPVTVGTGPYGCSKGSLKSSLSNPVESNILGMYRGAGGIQYSNAKLALQSYMSQYKTSRTTLKGRFNVYGQPLNLRTKLIKDSNFQGSKAFYIHSGTYLDREEMMDVQMVEVTNVRDAIVIT
jgi:hypothetical protein